MFYSHTFLARKGPLGTVWSAAHLQHRLKKNHYMGTDIISTVDRIMFPEVPIALRLSGHLLLGVVRIYSKKVDYLRQDCNFFLIEVRKDFPSSEINLPEGAACAPKESITLPERFELDTWNFEDEPSYEEGYQDIHCRSQDEITLPEQVPLDTNPFVTISLSEDLSPPYELGADPMEEDISPNLGDTNLPVPMEEDIPPSSNEGEAVQGPGPGNQENVPETNNEQRSRDNTSLDTPERQRAPHHGNGTDNVNELLVDDTPLDTPERQRALPHGNGTDIVNELLVTGSTVSAPTRFAGQSYTEKDMPSPSTVSMPDLEELTLPSAQRSPPFPSQFPDSLDIGSESPLLQMQPTLRLKSFSIPELQTHSTSEQQGLPNHELRIRPTPEQQVPANLPKVVRRRKRKFDPTIVLSNGFIKNAINDPSDTRRQRMMRPSSALDVWKFDNNLRKDSIFFRPLATGACVDIQNIYEKEFVSSRIKLARLEEDASEQSVHSQVHVPEVAGNIERRSEHSSESVPELQTRDPEVAGPSCEHEIVNSPGHVFEDPALPVNENRSDGSHFPTPESQHLREPGNMDQAPITEFFPLPHQAPSCQDYSGSFGNLNAVDSPDVGELAFLEADSNASTAGSAGTQGSTLSVRTRATALYLKELSPVNQIPGGLSEPRLNEILEGKTRKLCARMFFETLVLKSYGLVDVRQEEPYGDIMLKLTPKLSNDSF